MPTQIATVESNAIPLPAGFLKDGEQVEISILGSNVIVITRLPKRSLAGVYDALIGIPDDFYAEGRHDPPPDPVSSWDED